MDFDTANIGNQNDIVDLVAGLLSATEAMKEVNRVWDRDRLVVRLRPSGTRRSISITSLPGAHFSVATLDTEDNVIDESQVYTSGILGALAAAVDVARGKKPIKPYRKNDRRRTSRRRSS